MGKENQITVTESENTLMSDDLLHLLNIKTWVSEQLMLSFSLMGVFPLVRVAGST